MASSSGKDLDWRAPRGQLPPEMRVDPTAKPVDKFAEQVARATALLASVPPEVKEVLSVVLICQSIDNLANKIIDAAAIIRSGRSG